MPTDTTTPVLASIHPAQVKLLARIVSTKMTHESDGTFYVFDEAALHRFAEGIQRLAAQAQGATTHE